MYLSNYMDEVVEGYKCDKCGDNSEVKHRYQKIDHSPDVLIVQFKRFDHDGRKDSLAVPFSSVLDLNSHRAEDNEIPSVYELSAVVSHRGSLGVGHYRCTAMGSEKNWHTFDDQRMSRATAKEAVDSGKGGGWTPYLLFFQRKMQ
jgi:ubiquitin C-terminal hydrolase